MARRKKKKTLKQRPIIGIVIVALIIVAAGAWWMLSSPSSDFVLTDAMAAPASKGSPDAPVVIVEYADFQCDVCAIMALQVTPQIVQEFVDTGLVRMEYRHFVHKGDESSWAGMASECAKEQGLFWEYHDMLFDVQRAEPDTGAYTTARLKTYAERVGMDRDEFESCLGSGRYLDKLRADTREARERGATGTPTIFINDRRFGGLPPIDVFREVIRLELAEQGN